MSSIVVVLNADHSVINVIGWKRAYALISNGKAEIVENSSKTVKNVSGSFNFTVPKIIRLVRYISSVYKGRVAFSKKNIMIRDRYTCLYCGTKNNLTIDHVVPVSAGGQNSWQNCATCCSACNKKKSNKNLKDTGMKLAYQPYQPSVVRFLEAKVECLTIAREDISSS